MPNYKCIIGLKLALTSNYMYNGSFDFMCKFDRLYTAAEKVPCEIDSIILPSHTSPLNTDIY